MAPRRAAASEQRLLEYILDTARDNGLKIKLRPTKKIGPPKYGATGEYDGEALRVAHRSKYWFKVLVHEFCHWTQEQEGLWNLENYPIDVLNEWVDGSDKYSPQKIVAATRTIQRCELDCEKRVVKLAKRFDVDWDYDKYIRTANVYVLTYECTRRMRDWGSKRMPTRQTTLLDMVPSRFISRNRLGKLPEGFLEYWIARCTAR